ncbi:MAG: hypothetical protein ACKO23_20820 [Gemmataceae bacterium]
MKKTLFTVAALALLFVPTLSQAAVIVTRPHYVGYHVYHPWHHYWHHHWHR